MTETTEQGDVSGSPVEVPPGRAKSFALDASDVIARRREASIAFVAVVLFVYFAATTSNFMGSDNIRVIAQFSASVAILAIAEAMLLISGEIDVSLGHIYAMTPFLMYFGTEAGLPLPVAVVLALLGAGVVGLVNGLMTVISGVPSFITTLGMLFFLNGFTLTISDGFPKKAPTDGISDILGGARFAGFIWAAVFMVVVHVVLVSTGGGSTRSRPAATPPAHVRPASRSSASRSATSSWRRCSPGSPASARPSGSRRSIRCRVGRN